MVAKYKTNILQNHSSVTVFTKSLCVCVDPRGILNNNVHELITGFKAEIKESFKCISISETPAQHACGICRSKALYSYCTQKYKLLIHVTCYKADKERPFSKIR